MPNVYDDERVLNFYYISRAYHDFIKNRLQMATCMVKEMANCGQVSECYKD